MPKATAGFVRLSLKLYKRSNLVMARRSSPASTTRSALAVDASAPVEHAPTRPAAATRPDRRQAILLTAERLFAQHGYHAVTIRQIAHDAGVPLALVGYYFGQKHELFAAIFAHWNPTIEERLAGLRAAMASGGRDLLRRIVQAFVQPVLRLRASTGGEYYALLLARELAYSSPEADAVLSSYFDPMAHAFIDALQVALPKASRAQVAWGYQFALGALLHHLSDNRVERLSLGQARPHAPEAAPLLVGFIVAGLRALAALPAPATPAGPLPARPGSAPTSRMRHRP
jgi:AcrR family transcriptional regulator